MKLWPGARVLVLSPTPTHPQDYGNRKRIFQVCSRLAADGAQITFVHYPAEQEWRGTIPLRAENAMMAAWTRYYTVGVSRELHAAPHGHHHGIDEWWDDAIGKFLSWIFSVQSFDVFIVNYTWLSKAFEYAPRSVFKILDTHDKFSGRRELLESLGLHPEFFYTTADEERIALERADLVWAIKKEEKAVFEGMSRTPVVAMPHLDPYRELARPAADPDGFFRVGVIGARNNINQVNIGNFLRVADPIFRDAFAPIRIDIAGTVCDMFADSDSPFVRLHGRVDDVEDFYRTVDCVAIPMNASTGLKIKTGEAISLGLPVVSLAHAFEGYEPADPLHVLPDYTRMAEALVELAFARPGRLAALAGASTDAHARTGKAIGAAFDETYALALERRRSIVLAVDSRAFVPGTIFAMALQSTFEYLTNLANVTVLVARGRAAEIVQNAAAVDRFRSVVVSADLKDAAGLRADLAANGVGVHAVDLYLRQARPQILVLDALHPALLDKGCAQAFVISRVEMIALSEGGAEFHLPTRDVRRSVIATPQLSEDVAALAANGNAETLIAPCLWRSSSIRFPKAPHRGDAMSVVLLGAPRAPAVAVAATMARAWGMVPRIVSSIAEAACDGDVPSGLAECQRVDDYLAGVLAGRTALPSFAVDLGSGRPGLPLCREFFDRVGVATVTATPVAGHRALAPEGTAARATTERELWDAFRLFAARTDVNGQEPFRHRADELQGDGGWSWIWKQCMHLFESGDTEFI